VLIDTSRYQAIVGHAGSERTANLKAAIETPFAAVQVASLDERPLSSATSMLLVVGARVANTDMKWLDESRQSLGRNWGKAPTRIEPVVGTVALSGLAGASKVLAQPLDGCGQPLGEARPCARQPGDSSARFVLNLDAGQPTLWYLLTVER
jgi:hypothetical protein